MYINVQRKRRKSGCIMHRIISYGLALFLCVCYEKEVSTNCTTFNILIIYEVYVYVYL